MAFLEDNNILGDSQGLLEETDLETIPLAWQKGIIVPIH